MKLTWRDIALFSMGWLIGIAWTLLWKTIGTI